MASFLFLEICVGRAHVWSPLSCVILPARRRVRARLRAGYWANNVQATDKFQTTGSFMRDAAPQTVYLKDYKPFGYIVESVELTFRLAPRSTRVLSRIRFAPNPQTSDRRFFLNGEDVRLIRAAIDGEEITSRH